MRRFICDGGSVSTGPADRQTLRLLERQFAADGLIGETAFLPDSYEPAMVRATITETRHPETIGEARLDVRWFESGDFSFHYIESREHDSDERWECRWDRHPNPHNERTHFHEPPDAVQVVNLSLPSRHPLEVYSTVMDAIEHRLERLW